MLGRVQGVRRLRAYPRRKDSAGKAVVIDIGERAVGGVIVVEQPIINALKI